MELDDGIGYSFFPFKYNIEMIFAADGPPQTRLWDIGIMAGKYLQGGRNNQVKITFSGGIDYMLATKYVGSGTGLYSYEKTHLHAIGFISELKIFRTLERFGGGNISDH